MKLVLGLLMVGTSLLCAQTATPRPGVIRAIGEGSVTVQPDVARMSFGVVTRAATANEAATKNAEQSAAMIAKLRELLGATAEIRTVSYSVSPNYQHHPNSEPTITGFIATNQVQTTIADLSIIGRVIDAAIQSGANQVYGPFLELKEDAAAKAQALREAGQKARAKAEAIAQGLGLRLGQIVAAQEGSVYHPLPLQRDMAVAAKATPIETGTLDIHATITLDIEILQ